MMDRDNVFHDNELAGTVEVTTALARVAVASRGLAEFWRAATRVVSDWAGGGYVRIDYAGRTGSGTAEAGGERFEAATPVEHRWQDEQGRTVSVAVVADGQLPGDPPLGTLVEMAASLGTLVGRRAVLERERRLTSFLVELSRWMMTSATDSRTLLRYTLQSVMTLIGADGVLTLVRPPGATGLQVRGAVGSATRLTDAMDVGIADVSVRIVETGHPLLINEPNTDPDLSKSSDLCEWLAAAMIVPLKASSGTFGVLCALRSTQQVLTATNFTLDDLSYLDAVAAHIAGGIELADAVRLAQLAAHRAHAMVDGTPLPLAMLSGTGEMERVNDAFLELMGQGTRDEIVGRAFESLPVRPQGGTVAHLLRAAREGGSWEGPILVDRSDDRRTCDGVVTRLDEASGAELLVALYDRTDQLRAQRELIAREKLATIGELASGVAHEVNNPLAAIRMEAELMAHGSDDRQTNEAVGVILKEVDRAARIARSLLHLTRRSGTAPEYVQINDLLRDVVEIRARVARSDGITIRAELDPKVPSLHVPAADLQQVFINLVTNAEHAVQGLENAVVEVRSVLDNDVVRVSVGDSGSGVDFALRTRIFDPFFTTKDPDEGSGLGLALSQSIVTDLGGRIWVEDSTMGGAEFIVQLPLAGGPT